MSTLTDIILPVLEDIGVLPDESSPPESMLGVCRPLLPFPMRELDRPTGSPWVMVGSYYLYHVVRIIIAYLPELWPLLLQKKGRKNAETTDFFSSSSWSHYNNFSSFLYIWKGDLSSTARSLQIKFCQHEICLLNTRIELRTLHNFLADTNGEFCAKLFLLLKGRK